MTTPERQVWKPDRSAHAAVDGRRVDATSWTGTLLRGIGDRCPACGKAKLFAGYLAVVPVCASCSMPLGSLPADDVPPWITMLIALHVMVGLVVVLGRTTSLGAAATVSIVLPVALVLCLVLLRPVKGLVVGILVKLDLRDEHEEPAR